MIDAQGCAQIAQSRAQVAQSCAQVAQCCARAAQSCAQTAQSRAIFILFLSASAVLCQETESLVSIKCQRYPHLSVAQIICKYLICQFFVRKIC